MEADRSQQGLNIDDESESRQATAPVSIWRTLLNSGPTSLVKTGASVETTSAQTNDTTTIMDSAQDMANLALVQWPEGRKQPSAEAEDEWAGLGDPKERRKRQNRINQRAFRQRRRAQQKKATIQDQIEEMIARGEVTLLPRTSSSSSTSPQSSSSTHYSPPSNSATTSTSSPDTTNTNPLVYTWERRMCFLGDEIDKLLERFSRNAVESYALGSPSSDHLLTLCKVNVFRAFMTNMATLGMSAGPEWMEDEAISPFSTSSPGYLPEDRIPTSLRPTKLQTSTIHHPWLDFFPFPRIRDNLIMAGDFDDHPLCLDIMGFWNVTDEACGLLVWGEAHDPRNWEVSENFLRRWPWVVAGCPELLESTNRWRSSRGEKMIFRYL
ncbi:DUF3425 domain-containing protein [Aspergillus mulundensis]|uniref:BZIP domain-containing protein n=1 Tax=Aspergillus mulundensis TaxID=1810919 RepID=A0A3D8T5E3_9EURO|nr:Uncharacterized protein DSM5745_01108 [Aspergillus mulundensis]RDW93786.1 Uncharacterized protein DSM5745_01108 [Aspergillus mulundensis]